MEDEETGEVFLPCKHCTEKCYKNHHKRKEKERSDGSAYFFKVVLEDFAEKLRIPPAFVPRLTITADENVVLQGPNGKEWVVKLRGTNPKLEFTHGWGKFVHHHAIGFGDFVVFKYISGSNFKVRIFGRNGCAKNIAVCEPKKTNTDTEKECSDEAEVVAEHQRKKAKPTSHCQAAKSPNWHYQPSLAVKEDKTAESPMTNKCFKHPYYVSSRRPGSEAERKKALKAAQSFKSEKPFCLVTMNRTSVYRGFMLAFPITCELDYLPLSRDNNGELVLVDPNSIEWKVRVIWHNNKFTLSGGWKAFSTHNRLEEGDLCIFEQVDKKKNTFILKVHIFRVLENHIPYRKMRGR